MTAGLSAALVIADGEIDIDEEFVPLKDADNDWPGHNAMSTGSWRSPERLVAELPAFSNAPKAKAERSISIR